MDGIRVGLLGDDLVVIGLRPGQSFRFTLTPPDAIKLAVDLTVLAGTKENNFDAKVDFDKLYKETA